MTNDTVIKAGNVSKKYCRELKHTMLYGINDISKNAIGLSSRSERLRDGEFWALDDISFEMKRGESIGIIGANGSGKSTLLKLLNGIFMPDKGKIEIKGKVGALIEVGAGFHPMLTGRENIYINGAILGMSKREIDKKFDEIVDFADIGDFLDSPVKHYSSGMYVRLGFAVAVHSEPDILLVDEVLAVGDVRFQRKCFAKMNELRKNRKTILFVSHDINSISQFCSEAILLDHGVIIKQGNPKDVGKLYHKILFGQENQLNKTTVHEISLTGQKAEYITAQVDADELLARQKLKQCVLRKLNISDVSISSEEMRYGNKKAEIIDYGILDKDGERATILKSGENYTIFSRVLCYENIKDIHLGFGIKNPKGIDLFAVNTLVQEVEVPRVSAGDILEGNVKIAMWLAPANYFLYLSAWGFGTSNLYDRRIDALFFKVIGDCKMLAESLVNLDASLQIKYLDSNLFKT